MNDRQKQIIKAATTLFLSEGVGVSTARIAKAAGVSNGTLFNAFSTKQDLIDAIYTQAKTGMFGALQHSGDAAFDRRHLYENWQGYLAWARANAQARDVMHLLLDAGLASQQTQADMYAVAAPHSAWIENALTKGIIKGPSAAFVGQLILFQIDLVITEKLNRTDADLAFEMLCNAIGLTQ